MKLLHSLLALSGLSSLLGSPAARCIEKKVPSSSNGFKHPNYDLANLQKSHGKKRRGKYAMPENYDSTPPFSRLPNNQIHPRHHRA